MRFAFCLALLSLALPTGGCSKGAGQANSPPASGTPIPVEPDGGIGDGATPLPEIRPAGETLFEASMPPDLLGQWRENNLSHAPTPEDCDQTSSTNRNLGKVLTVRPDGYDLFEGGGRLVSVHDRTDKMIDATFETSTTEQPTTARRRFLLQADGSLAINDENGSSQNSLMEYERCPEG